MEKGEFGFAVKHDLMGMRERERERGRERERERQRERERERNGYIHDSFHGRRDWKVGV